METGRPTGKNVQTTESDRQLKNINSTEMFYRFTVMTVVLFIYLFCYIDF